jgi:large subunit ribosomal protein L10
MNKEIVKQKESLVEEIYENIKGAKASIVVEYRGLSVAQLSTLRKQLRDEEATLTVLKNTLISKAASKAGYADLDKELEGPNALVITKKDPGATAKILTKFAKRNDALVVKGGIVEGKVVDAKDVATVASLPNKEGLLSMFLGCLQASVRNFACAIKAVADSKSE